MNIKPTPGAASLAGAYGVASKSGDERIGAASSGATEQSTTVSLSRASTLAESSSESDVRMDRVVAMREAIANGTLVIDTERIAEGLIQDARNLLAGK